MSDIAVPANRCMTSACVIKEPLGDYRVNKIRMTN